jgi:hypothetical protein
MKYTTENDFFMDSFNRDSVSCSNAAVFPDTKNISLEYAYDLSPAKVSVNSLSGIEDEVNNMKDKIKELDETVREAFKMCLELKKNVVNKQKYKYMTLNMEWEEL